MNELRMFLWAGLATALAAGGVQAQQQPITQRTGEAQQRSIEESKAGDSRYAVPLQAKEGLGKQPFLIRKKVFNVSFRESPSYSDNVFLLKDYKRGDFYNAADLSMSASLTMFKQWTASARASMRSFRYHRFQSLDFDSGNYSLGLNYSLDKWNIFTSLEHTDLYQRAYGPHFFQEEDITLGAYYTHVFANRLVGYVGGQFIWQFTVPTNSSKNMPMMFAGLIAVPFEELPQLRVNLTGSYSYADYLVSERSDHRFTIGSEVSYEFFEWLNAGVGASGGMGDSSMDPYDYSVLNAMTYVKLNYQF